jgi:hypothetical protein
VARGARCDGPHRCTFCAARAAAPYALPDSFTTRDTLAVPGSPWVCAGCLLCLQESGEAVYHDGTRYPFTKAYRRMLSHVVTASAVVQATKAHTAYLRSVCLSPPGPPYAVSIAVSGQKHVLYRGVACRSADVATVTLEGERIDYRSADLAARLRLAGRVCAATGKPALVEPPGPSMAIRLVERYADGESDFAAWSGCWEHPLSRLAAFLCPPKEESQREHPGDRPDGIPPAGGGAGGPHPPADRSGRKPEPQGGGERTLFDLV